LTKIDWSGKKRAFENGLRCWVLAVAVAASVGIAGCTDGNELEIELGEWYIAAPQVPVKAGKVILNTRNSGDLVHEIEILKVDGRYQEFEMAELVDIGPGSTESLTVELEPGSYTIICTIVEKAADGTVLNHYDLGMRTTMTVEE
jgi:uncharacterized cupredoxin-like copper-binding protein